MSVRPIERTAYWIGGLLIASGVAHLGVLVATGGTWAGPLSMRKPATFGLSFGLTLANVTLLAVMLPLKERSRRWLIGLLAAACVLETSLVTLQAWRGVPSHFNLETPFDAAVARTLAAGGFMLVAIIVALTVAVFRHRRTLAPPVRLAIEAGFVALVAAQLAGGVMIATGMSLVFGGDPQRAYVTGGWLKPVHGVLMHGILVLPLLAWLVSRSHWPAGTQMRAVRIGVAAYAGVAAAAFASAFG